MQKHSTFHLFLLVVVPIFGLISCVSDKKEAASPQWQGPLLYVKSEQNQQTQSLYKSDAIEKLTLQDTLTLGSASDWSMQQNSEVIPTPKGIHSLKIQSACRTSEAKAQYLQFSMAPRPSWRVYEMLPLSSLRDILFGKPTSCSFRIVAGNSKGSTKAFRLAPRLPIVNFFSDIQAVNLEDFGSGAISWQDQRLVVNGSQSRDVSVRSSHNDTTSLLCQNMTGSSHRENPTLADLQIHLESEFLDLDPRDIQPLQSCYIFIRSPRGEAHLSEAFDIQFQSRIRIKTAWNIANPSRSHGLKNSSLFTMEIENTLNEDLQVGLPDPKRREIKLAPAFKGYDSIFGLFSWNAKYQFKISTYIANRKARQDLVAEDGLLQFVLPARSVTVVEATLNSKLRCPPDNANASFGGYYLRDSILDTASLRIFSKSGTMVIRTADQESFLAPEFSEHYLFLPANPNSSNARFLSSNIEVLKNERSFCY